MCVGMLSVQLGEGGSEMKRKKRKKRLGWVRCMWVDEWVGGVHEV